MRDAKRRGLDGVICGHIHKAEMRHARVDEKLIEYFNCGDWIESCTALVEHHDGSLQLIDAADWLHTHPPNPAQSRDPMTRRREPADSPQTLRAIDDRLVRR